MLKDNIIFITHHRFLETIKSNAKTWRSKIGFEYAEAFELVRSLK